jgi:hypothetical protein
MTNLNQAKLNFVVCCLRKESNSIIGQSRTIPVLATILNMKKATLYRWVKSGSLELTTKGFYRPVYKSVELTEQEQQLLKVWSEKVVKNHQILLGLF